MKVGIITDPSTTFRLEERRKVFVFDIDQIPKQYKDTKISFLEFFGGNFLEIKTLRNEVTNICNCEVVIVYKNAFLHENDKTQIDYRNFKESTFDVNTWIDSLDIIIVCIRKKNLLKFLNNITLPTNKKLIVSSGIKDKALFNKIDLHLPRKGVARFSQENRLKIISFITELKEKK